MSRYSGPRLRIARRLGMDLPGLTSKSSSRRAFAPGQHGAAGTRRKKTEFALHLIEKQKLRFNYGVGEKQFRLLMAEAKRQKGDSGENLLRLLEQRLDNIVFRMGVGRSIPQARQLVNHGHIKVNGRRVDIPSFRVKPGMVITLTDKILANELVKQTLQSPSIARPAYLKMDNNSAEMIDLPGRQDVPFEVRESLVVEYYAQRL